VFRVTAGLLRAVISGHWDHRQLAVLYSFDLDEGELDSISSKFRSQGVYFYKPKKLGVSDFPLVRDRNEGLRSLHEKPPALELQVVPAPPKSIHPASTLVHLPKLPFTVPEDFSGTWVIDARLGLHPEEFVHTDLNYWWRLPRRIELGRIISSNLASRVNHFGEVSIEVASKLQATQFFIPSEESVFWPLLTNMRYDNVEQKERLHQEKKNSVESLELSDKGKYLQGTVRLLGGLWQTARFFSEGYWRDILEYMAKSPRVHIQEQACKIKETIIEELGTKRITDEEAESLANILGKRFLQKTAQEEHVTIGFFYDRTAALNRKLIPGEKMEAFTFIPHLGITQSQKDELDAEIQELVDLNVLQVGVRPKCPNCGSYIWYPIGEISKTIQCAGCQYNYGLPIESAYFYRLNSLIREGISRHGTMPLVLALYHILEESRESFLYLPCLKLYTGDKQELGELDVVVISDGKFIIGEVKSSAAGLRKPELDQVTELARMICPDTLILCFAEKEIDKRRSAYHKNVSANLHATGVSVELQLLPEYGAEGTTYPYIAS
jgi:hypothetical protein